MKDFLDQIEMVAEANGLYYVALFGALAIPDICGALDSSDGRATRAKYESWFNAHVAPRHVYRGKPILSGEACYQFRCSMLHQGKTMHPSSEYSRVLFVEPGHTRNVFHMNVMNDVLNIDVRLFCLDMVECARKWLEAASGTESLESNLRAFVRRYPEGLPPYITGVPVIS